MSALAAAVVLAGFYLWKQQTPSRPVEVPPMQTDSPPMLGQGVETSGGWIREAELQQARAANQQYAEGVPIRGMRRQ